MAMIKVEVPDGEMCEDCEQWYSCDSLGRYWRCPHRKKPVRSHRLKLARKTKACKEAHVEVSK